jgi:splicing factor 3A subunit 1
MRLAARFVARHGSRFLTGLTAREQRNPQFDFLKSSHALFPYFQQMVEAYASILNPPRYALERLEKHCQDWIVVYHDLLPYVERERIQAEKERAEAAGDEKNRSNLALIDWLDFVVAGTVPITEDEFFPAEGETSCNSSADVLKFLQMASAPEFRGETDSRRHDIDEDEGDDMDID